MRAKNCNLDTDTITHGSGLKTMIRTQPCPFWQQHTVAVPPCCPATGNPQSGTISVRYRPAVSSLEVFALEQYVKSFVGGHESGERNQEGMIQLIAQDCAAAAGVSVRVAADLVLRGGQRLLIVARAKP